MSALTEAKARDNSTCRAGTEPSVSVPARHDRRPPRHPTLGGLAPGVLIAAGGVISVALMVVSVTLGSADIGGADVWRAIQSMVIGAPVDPAFTAEYTVITGLRLPRVLLAFTAGAALSIGGVLMQGLLRNPLVSPFTLGVSPAAAFGAALVILLLGGRPSGAAGNLVALGALTSALAVSVIVLSMASFRSLSTATLLLLGIALTQLFEALTSAMQFVADENTLQQIVRWTFGSVNEATWTDVQTVLLLLAISLPIAIGNATRLNAVAFAGDDAAKSLGVNVQLLRTGLIGLAVLLAAVVVSLCGVIGFVGLVGPHIARLVIGSDHRYLIPFGGITGGALLLLADTIGRTIIAPTIIPVGIVVAIIGAPIFVRLILRRRSRSVE